MPSHEGGRTGTNLSGINNKTKEELLTDVLYPTYPIEPRYINYIAVTKDGYILNGVISNETPSLLTLRGGANGRKETLLRSNIAEIGPSSISLMPDNFETSLNHQDVADLLAYLRGGL